MMKFKYGKLIEEERTIFTAEQVKAIRMIVQDEDIKSALQKVTGSVSATIDEVNKRLVWKDFTIDSNGITIKNHNFNAETPLEEREDGKKYYVKVFKGYRGYLNVSYVTRKFMTADKKQTVSYQTQFTETEIEQLKQRDDIPLDWDKVKLIEVDDKEIIDGKSNL